jgi:sec-independent protein translocase protein TatC
MAETAGDPEMEFGSPEMPLLSHLNELRKRLTWIVAGVVVCTVISFAFAGTIFDFLIAPYGSVLRTHSPTEPLESFFKVSLVSGAILSMPIILLQVWKFIEPGLLKQEKRYVFVFLPVATGLFLAGIAFGWFVLIPTAIHFLSTFMSEVFVAEWGSQEYISFATTFLFWLGVSFEMPIVVYFLARTGVIAANVLREQWRFSLVAIAVVAAAVTPTVDPLTMTLTMLPLLVLYVISYGLARIGQKQFERSMAINEAGADSS